LTVTDAAHFGQSAIDVPERARLSQSGQATSQGTRVAKRSAMTTSETSQPKLIRAMGFWMLTAYGVGDILGAGIYALVGKIAAVAGSLSWLSFLLAGVVAGLTGLWWPFWWQYWPSSRLSEFASHRLPTRSARRLKRPGC
jgi:hypothetical protein